MLRRPYIICVIVIWSTLAFIHLFWASAKTVQIDASQIIPEIGFAYAIETPLKGDSMSSQHRSNLKLFENGKELGPSHSLHDYIRGTGLGAYSHWRKHVIFSSSDNSDPRKSGKTYSIAFSTAIPTWSLILAAVFSLPLASMLSLRIHQLTWPRYRAYIWDWAETLWFIVVAPVYVTVSASLLYLCYCVVCLLRGDVFFPAWPLITAGNLRLITDVERAFPAYVLLWATGSWIVINLLPFAGKIAIAQRTEFTLCWIYRYLGLPVILGIFILRLGCVWASPGYVSTYGAALGGIVPFSDAFGHFWGVLSYTQSGEFEGWVLRRPLAAAFRLGLGLLAGYDPIIVVFLQTVILATAAWTLGRTVLRYWGSIAAALSVIFVLIHSRVYLPTFLVEPLGLIFASCAIAILFEAMERRSLFLWVTGVGSVTMALLVRMGAMFILPSALVAILLSQGRKQWRKVVCVSLFSGTAVLICFSASSFVSNVYGGSNNQLGANFSYVLAGLSIGGNYSDAHDKYKGQLSGLDEKEQASKLYAIAFHNMRTQPSVFFSRLWMGAREFLRVFPEFMIRGMDGTASAHFFSFLFILALLRLFNSRHRLFWIMTLAAVPASAAVVYFDEGIRVICVAYPIIGVFLAGAMRTIKRFQPTATEAESSNALAAPALTLVLVVLTVCAPALALQFPPAQATAAKHVPVASHKSETTLWGAGTAAGVLVTPDDQELVPSEPSIKLEDFISSIEKSGVERYQKLVNPVPPKAPFSFIGNISPERYLYIGPPDLVRRKEVLVWKIVYKDWYEGGYWKEITEAIPLVTRGDSE